MPARRLAARWVLPVAGPAVAHGAVLLGEDGRIEAVGPDALVPRPADVLDERFPDGILLPGLVNTHTHLELTGLDLDAPRTDFRAWIGRLRTTKEARSAQAFLAAARAGVAECHAAGVTTVADTGDSGAVIRALAEAGGSGVAYQEVFGPHPAQAAAYNVLLVSNAGSKKFWIQLPPNGTVVISSGSGTMDVNDFTANLPCAQTGATPPGPGPCVQAPNALQVGATLIVGANQPVGLYSGTFNVTVHRF